MNERSLAEAEQEALRFLARVNTLRNAMMKPGNKSYRDCTVESGAVKRASMDLSRALAMLRKPG